MYKIAVLLKRKRQLAVEEFQDDWLMRRGASIADSPRVRRYVQSRPSLLAYRRGEPPCDGLDEIWFDDEAAFLAFRCSRGEGGSEQDTRLLDPQTTTMVVGEFVVNDGQPGPAAVKCVILNKRKAGLSRQQFFDYWQQRHARVAGHLPGLERYEQNPLERVLGGAMADYDGLSLAWFASMEALKALMSMPEYALALEDEVNFLEEGGRLPIFLTSERVLVEGPSEIAYAEGGTTNGR